jgi:hypothetical protein
MKKLLSSTVWGKKTLWLFERVVFGGRFTEDLLALQRHSAAHE